MTPSTPRPIRPTTIATLTATALILVACSSTKTNPQLAVATPDAEAGATIATAAEAAPAVAATTDELVPAGPAEVEVEEEVPAEEPAGGEDERPDPDQIQQEALELCQSAAEFLDQGDVDDAIAALDHAYELMLELPNDGDVTYLQAKEDLRVLVASLITRTYASQRTVAREPRTSWDLEIPIVSNQQVKREIVSLSTVEREQFLDGYRRSGRYRPMILAKLEAAGLPSQLSWMPLVESWFKARALSRASALGLWQFIHSTGLRYGLSRDAWIDQRMDPEKATDAAIAYLSELHDLFGDWPKALAAYNCGEARVMRLTNRQPGEYQDFWDLYQLLPSETRRYVPRFFASLLIIEEPEKYGVTLPDPDSPLDLSSTVTVNRSVKLERLDAELGLAKGTLASLNPVLRHAATPNRPYDLRVPATTAPLVLAHIDLVPVWSPPKPAYVTHRVRRGETLSVIARRYRTSVSAIMRSNRIRSAHRIWPGQRLRIPVRGRVSTGTYDAAEGTHTVNRGESLYSIARRYHTTVDRIKRDNGLGSNLIQPGQRLKVRPGSRSGARRYEVRRGDTLSRIASAHHVSLSALLRANGLSSRSTIYPGQWLAIPD